MPRSVHKPSNRAARGELLWAAIALPGALWLVLLFVVPFYAMVAVAFGGANPLFQTPVPAWNPLHWSGSNFTAVWHDIVGPGAYIGPALLRTLLYTAAASALALAIAYPVAYFVTRFSGRRRALFLTLLIAPFWVSYMMRMLAWVDLLQTNGYANAVLSFLHLSTQPVDWLGGHASTVILGLVYGYIPYLILVLYAGLDRVDQRLIEAARDLGLGPWRTFCHVTLRLSRPTILAGMLITALPMAGDYYTNQLLSNTPSTTEVGNQVEGLLSLPGANGQGAALALILLAILAIPIAFYVRGTMRGGAGALA
ncbi:MAG TPA: ABC transporter permease [Solirubrobacteraceae bacterium]|nr:ABC transporter permease [Solirubrobacteraceae bacterium]